MPVLPTPRLLVVPGLHGSGPTHWQSWLEARHAGSRRMQVGDWDTPQLDDWADCLEQAYQSEPDAQWLIVAHSFGCLTAAHWARRHGSHRIRAALLVAPANPGRFCLDAAYFDAPLPFPTTVVTSRNDPWFAEREARAQAHRWSAAVWDAGLAGHINVDSGHGPWPLGEALVRALASTTERPTPPQRPRAGEPHPASTAPQPRLFHPRKHVFIRSAPQDRFPE